MRYANGEVKPRKQDAAVTAAAKEVYDRIRLADFEARGIMALSADVMEGLAELDAHRKKLAGDDPALNALLTPFEIEAAMEAREIIREVRQPVRRLSW